MSPAILEAPAKLNLCLYVGPRRDDGLHEIRSLFQPLELADGLVVVESEADEVVSDPALEGPDLAAQALAALREAGWKHPPIRIEVRKRIPIAAGLGGGSADAAAVLRLARGEVEGIERIAAGLGADVPSQLDPKPSLVSGAGEVVEPIEPLPPLGVLLLPQAEGLPTAEVYAEADRLGLPRDPGELDRLEARLRAAIAGGSSPLEHPELLVNDLQPAALSLCPELDELIGALLGAGAAYAGVTGSGPTVFGLYPGGDGVPELSEEFASAIATSSRVAG
jgi:4-diphosphocytidyl-2-C-methyl-D-erythritol kinase